MQTVVDIASISPIDRPPLLADVIAWLVKLNAPSDAILSVEPDGTLRVVTYREVTPAEKLAVFLDANPDVTPDTLAAASAKV